MNNDLLKTLVPFFRENSPLFVKKGQVIIRPEDKIDHIYFIEKGYVRFYHISEDGRELTFLIYKPGYLFPVVYTFLGKSTRYYFEAVTPLILRRTTKEDFAKIVNSNPSLVYLIIQEIVKRLDESLEKMEHLSYGSANKTVAYIIKSCAEEFGQVIGNKIVIKVPLTHQLIASMAGLARETVSVEMKKLREMKAISYRRSLIQINDLKIFANVTNLDF